jgi:phosphocarrier protein HPr
MIQRTVTITAAQGMHARPAGLLVKQVRDLASPITLTKVGGGSTPANSILGILSLQIQQGDDVVLSSDGQEAEADLDALAELLETGLGE